MLNISCIIIPGQMLFPELQNCMHNCLSDLLLEIDSFGHSFSHLFVFFPSIYSVPGFVLSIGDIAMT